MKEAKKKRRDLKLFNAVVVVKNKIIKYQQQQLSLKNQQFHLTNFKETKKNNLSDLLFSILCINYIQK